MVNAFGVAVSIVTDRSNAVVLMCFSVACLLFRTFADVTPYESSYCFCSVRLLSGHLLGKAAHSVGHLFSVFISYFPSWF